MEVTSQSPERGLTMKSVLLLGASIVSFLAATAAAVVQPTTHDPGQDRIVVGVVYDIFGRNIQDSEGIADSLTVVSKTAGCKWCRKFSPVVRRLQRNGYKVTVVEASEYKGSVEITGYPTLIYNDGDKVVESHMGYVTYDVVTENLRKPDQ